MLLLLAQAHALRLMRPPALKPRAKRAAVQAATLATATLGGARAFGLGDELGSLEVGKRADLLLVEGDPLVDLDALRNIMVVVKDGALIVDYR